MGGNSARSGCRRFGGTGETLTRFPTLHRFALVLRQIPHPPYCPASWRVKGMVSGCGLFLRGTTPPSEHLVPLGY